MFFKENVPACGSCKIRDVIKQQVGHIEEGSYLYFHENLALREINNRLELQLNFHYRIIINLQIAAHYISQLNNSLIIQLYNRCISNQACLFIVFVKLIEVSSCSIRDLSL